MKGTVLALPDGTGPGLIATADGRRLTFRAEEWRGPRELRTGTRVDCEVREDVAVAIYPDASPFGQVQQILAAAAGSAPGRRATTLLTRTLEAPLAALMLFACLLTFISIEPVNPRLAAHDFSLFGAGSEVAVAIQRIEQAGNPFAAAPSADELSMMAAALAPRWAAPVLALVLLVALWLDRNRRWLTVACGIAAGITFLNAFGVARGVEQAAPQLLGVETGLGAWLILGCGIGLLLAAFGKIRNPLAAPAD